MSLEKQKRIEEKERIFESDSQRIEQDLTKVESEIKALEASIARLQGKDDQPIAQGLAQTLHQKRIEQQKIKNKASELLNKIEQLGQDLRKIDHMNNEAHTEVNKLRAIGINTSDAEVRIADREKWVGEQDKRISDIKRRVQQLVKSPG